MPRKRIVTAVVLAGVGLGCFGLQAQGSRIEENRNFDARVALQKTAAAAPTALSDSGVAELRRSLPELLVSYHPATGALRSLWNPAGALTAPAPGRDPLDVALGYLQDHVHLLGLSTADLAEVAVTDRVPGTGGAIHLYLRQEHHGLPVYNGQLQVHLDREGRILSVNNDFLPDLGFSVKSPVPTVDAGAAVRGAAQHLGTALRATPQTLAAPAGVQRVTRLSVPELSREPIEARLMLLPIGKGDARLVWNFQVHTRDTLHVWDLTVDAATAKVWTRFDMVAADSYRVYPRPVESPNHTAPLPPADSRQLIANPAAVPATSTSSPFGWHDTDGIPGPEHLTMQGNNVHAYEDSDADNLPPSVEPSCGAGLNCTFPLDLTLAPSAYQSAAIANLFYWNNLLHDIQALYGFTSAAGNFQANTYGAGGVGGDDVNAEAQDGANINNATFFTPPDGQQPRMQMFLWNRSTPFKDGDFDSGIMTHEYGHGISNRLIGGPSNVFCLFNSQAPSEGLSDWWALAYTHEWGDQGTDPRNIGTYVTNQPLTGPGIRTQRYSTDPAVNTMTYASIGSLAIPHGVGSVWAQGAWEVYWKLVDTWGFFPYLHYAHLNYGNMRMMHYVNEGLKFTACSPTFTDVRDGILQAASLQYGGVDVCRMWKAWAAFGLGTDATSGGSNSTVATNGFLTPPSCDCALTPFRPQAVSASATSGTAVTASCPAGQKVLHGGCSSSGGAHPRTSAPQGNSAWDCTFDSNPGTITAWANCAVVPDCKGYEIVSTTATSGTNVPYLKCPTNKILLGGGCRDNLNNTVLESSYPWDSDGWVCNWVNGGNLTAYAICGDGSLDVQFGRKTETVSNTMTTACPAGKKIVSGGCADDFTSTVLEASKPSGASAWSCTWSSNPGSLTMYTVCEDP